MNNHNKFLKIQFYILSLLVLFFLIILLSIQSPFKCGKFIGISKFIMNNIITIISFLFCFLSLFIFYKLKHSWKD